MTSDTIPSSEWTDDEWLWAMSTFHPNTKIAEVERRVATRRREATN